MQLFFGYRHALLTAMDVITMLALVPGCLGFALLLEWSALKIIVTVLRPQPQVIPEVFRDDPKTLQL